jgi:hypothetical protein
LYQLYRLRLLVYQWRIRRRRGRVQRRPPWAKEKVDLVANKGGLMRKVDSKLGLGASEHGGERSVSGNRTAGRISRGEKRLDTTRDLLVRNHGVRKAGGRKLKIL